MGWEFDSAHSRVECFVKYLGIVTVRGEFRAVEGDLDLEGDDPTHWSAVARIEVASFESFEERRDQKVRGPEYFDAERFPTITFGSKAVERSGSGYRVLGDLTIRGITHEVALDGTFNGEARSARGRRTRGFSMTTSIRRSDFDVHTTSSDGSHMLEADEVRIALEIGAAWRD